MDLKVSDERAKENSVVLEVLHRPPLYVRSPVEQLAFDLLADRATLLARIAELERKPVSQDFSGDNLQHIIDKCEQYWNAHGICDAEVHSALEFIVMHAYRVRDKLAELEAENERMRS